MLKVTRRLIEGKLSELLRRQINDDLVFDVISPRGNTSHHAWFETMKYLCTFYDMPDQLLQSNRHVLQSQLDLTSCTLLTALKHNFPTDWQTAVWWLRQGMFDVPANISKAI